MSKLTAIDMFAGLGGFSEGAEQAGAQVLWAANHWALAVNVHQRNHPKTKHVVQDLHQANWFEVPSMDLVLASPACQGHSQAATRQLARRRRGTAPRHDEYRATAWAVPSCAEVHDPPFVLVENVVDFKNWIGFKAWCGYWNDLGYSLSEHVLNAADFGVPQDRKRLFILATRGRKPLVLNPRHREHVAFKSCVDSNAGNWEPVASKPPAVRARVAKGRKTFPRGMFMTQHVTGHPGRSLDRPLPTVTTKHQMALVRSGKSGDEMRMLTADEYRCGMGFPDRYWLPDSICDSVKLLGNAVCPPVAAALVREIMRRG